MYWLKVTRQSTVICFVFFICAEINLSAHVSSRSFRHWHHTVCALLAPASTLDCTWDKTSKVNLTLHSKISVSLPLNDPELTVKKKWIELLESKKTRQEVKTLAAVKRHCFAAALSTININVWFCRRSRSATGDLRGMWAPFLVSELFWKWSVHGCKKLKQTSKECANSASRPLLEKQLQFLMRSEIKKNSLSDAKLWETSACVTGTVFKILVLKPNIWL